MCAVQPNEIVANLQQKIPTNLRESESESESETDYGIIIMNHQLLSNGKMLFEIERINGESAWEPAERIENKRKIKSYFEWLMKDIPSATKRFLIFFSKFERKM